jgi:hypothetical protein
MPRPRGASWARGNEVDLALAEIMDGAGDSPRDSDGALRLLEGGGLTDGEREEIREAAEDALHDLEWLAHVEEIGAVKTGPADAVVAIREARERDVLAWKRVLTELDAIDEESLTNKEV